MEVMRDMEKSWIMQRNYEVIEKSLLEQEKTDQIPWNRYYNERVQKIIYEI